MCSQICIFCHNKTTCLLALPGLPTRERLSISRRFATKFSNLVFVFTIKSKCAMPAIESAAASFEPLDGCFLDT